MFFFAFTELVFFFRLYCIILSPFVSCHVMLLTTFSALTDELYMLCSHGKILRSFFRMEVSLFCFCVESSHGGVNIYL